MGADLMFVFLHIHGKPKNRLVNLEKRNTKNQVGTKVKCISLANRLSYFSRRVGDGFDPAVFFLTFLVRSVPESAVLMIFSINPQKIKARAGKSTSRKMLPS